MPLWDTGRRQSGGARVAGEGLGSRSECLGKKWGAVLGAGGIMAEGSRAGTP